MKRTALFARLSYYTTLGVLMVAGLVWSLVDIPLSTFKRFTHVVETW
jgi:hypothetical protein